MAVGTPTPILSALLHCLPALPHKLTQQQLFAELHGCLTAMKLGQALDTVATHSLTPLLRRCAITTAILHLSLPPRNATHPTDPRAHHRHHCCACASWQQRYRCAQVTWQLPDLPAGTAGRWWYWFVRGYRHVRVAQVCLLLCDAENIACLRCQPLPLHCCHVACQHHNIANLCPTLLNPRHHQTGHRPRPGPDSRLRPQLRRPPAARAAVCAGPALVVLWCSAGRRCTLPSPCCCAR